MTTFQLPKSVAAALLLATLPAAAAPFDDVVRLDVIPGWQTADGTHMAAFRFTLAPGWKTYWRKPGDAGIPPHFDWNGSENIATANFRWPTPQVIDQDGIQTIGYTNSLVLPVVLTPTADGAQMRLAGEVTLGVCEDICVPVSRSFAMDLPLDGRRDGAITAALLNQPLSATEAGIDTATCDLVPTQDGLQLTATLPAPDVGPVTAVVVEAGQPEIWVSQADYAVADGALQAVVDMIHVTGQSFVFERGAVRITVLGADYAVDVQGCTAG